MSSLDYYTLPALSLSLSLSVSLALCGTANTMSSNGDGPDTSGKAESGSSPIFPTAPASPVKLADAEKITLRWCAPEKLGGGSGESGGNWQQADGNKVYSLVQIDLLKLCLVYPFCPLSPLLFPSVRRSVRSSSQLVPARLSSSHFFPRRCMKTALIPVRRRCCSHPSVYPFSVHHLFI